MQFRICDLCNGKKKVFGLGGMLKDCPVCKGMGRLNIEEKKRGRKRASDKD